MTLKIKTYLAIGPNVWGKGKTRDDAFKNMRKANHGRMPKKWAVYESDDPDIIIDDMGYVVAKSKVDNRRAKTECIEKHNLRIAE